MHFVSGVDRSPLSLDPLDLAFAHPHVPNVFRCATRSVTVPQSNRTDTATPSWKRAAAMASTCAFHSALAADESSSPARKWPSRSVGIDQPPQFVSGVDSPLRRIELDAHRYCIYEITRSGNPARSCLGDFDGCFFAVIFNSRQGTNLYTVSAIACDYVARIWEMPFPGAGYPPRHARKQRHTV